METIMTLSQTFDISIDHILNFRDTLPCQYEKLEDLDEEGTLTKEERQSVISLLGIENAVETVDENHEPYDLENFRDGDPMLYKRNI